MPDSEYARAGFPADPFELPPEERLRLAEATIRYLNLPGRPATLSVCALLTASRVQRTGHRTYGGCESRSGWAHSAGRDCVGHGSCLGMDSGAAGSLRAWSALAQGGRSRWRCCWDWRLDADRVRGGFFQAFRGVLRVGTWVFSYSDTLIRLFPLPFWQDAGLIVAGGSACWQRAL